MKIALSETDTNFHRYKECLEFFKADYEKLSYKNDDEDAAKLNECHGLLLTGGVDIYPELYCDWDTKETHGTYTPERDGFELKIMEQALKRNMPILGICRGCQLINVYFRGSLIFDLPDIRGVHHEKLSPTEDRIHNVRIYKDTLLDEIIKNEEITVNSAHHQSPDRIGEGLRANCKSIDGVVEGVEYAEKDMNPFLLGIMWHPERFKDFKVPGSKNIIERFINEAEKYEKTL